MATKKNFESIDTSNTREAGTVETAMSQATSKYGQQPIASPEEAKQRRQQFRTQGRRGTRLSRLNAAFSDDNYEFIKTVSAQKGLTMTAFLNHIVNEYRETHGATPEVLAQLKELIDKL